MFCSSCAFFSPDMCLPANELENIITNRYQRLELEDVFTSTYHVQFWLSVVRCAGAGCGHP